MSTGGAKLIEQLDVMLDWFNKTAAGTEAVLVLTRPQFDELEDHLLVLGDLNRLGDLRAKRWKECVVIVVQPPAIYGVRHLQKMIKGEAL